MKPLIGALTAGIALDDITNACSQNGNKCDILYLSYQNYYQAEKVLTSSLKKLDGVIYGGPRSYKVAKIPQDTNIPYEILQIGKADFYELLLKAVVVDNIPINRISVDFIDEHDNFRGLSLILTSKQMPYICPLYNEHLDIDNILSHHINLYKKGKIDCIMTTLPTVAEGLKSLGIKHYYIQPSVDTLADALERVTNKALANTINGGLSVLGIVTFAEGDYYKLYRLLSEFSVTNCPHMVVNRNENSCHLITQNKWFMELTLNYTRPALIPWLKERGVSVNIGWGIGSGLSSAADNAGLALEQSVSQGEGHCYIANEESKVTGPIGTMYCFTYSREITPALQAISEHSGLSVLYIQKLKGMCDQIVQNSLSCEQIGMYLNISRRSANRVLNQLEQSGYASIILSNQKGGRGRPTKLYTLNLD